MAIETPPTINPLPTPTPSRLDGQSTFDTRAQSHVAALPTWTTEVIALGDNVKNNADETLANANAAATSETNAGTSETNAANSALLAQDWAEKAEDVEVTTGKYSALHHSAKAEAFKDSAQAAAASAAGAAGLPSLVGNGRKVLKVADNELTVGWDLATPEPVIVASETSVYTRTVGFVNNLRISDTAFIHGFREGSLVTLQYITEDGAGDFTVESTFSTTVTGSSFWNIFHGAPGYFYLTVESGTLKRYQITGTTIGSETTCTSLASSTASNFKTHFNYTGGSTDYLYLYHRNSGGTTEARCYSTTDGTTFSNSGSTLGFGSGSFYSKVSFNETTNEMVAITDDSITRVYVIDFSGNSTPVNKFTSEASISGSDAAYECYGILWFSNGNFGFISSPEINESQTGVYHNYGNSKNEAIRPLVLYIYDPDNSVQSADLDNNFIKADLLSNNGTWMNNQNSTTFVWNQGSDSGFIFEPTGYKANDSTNTYGAVSYLEYDPVTHKIYYSGKTMLDYSYKSNANTNNSLLINNSNGTAFIATDNVGVTNGHQFTKVSL